VYLPQFGVENFLEMRLSVDRLKDRDEIHMNAIVPEYVLDYLSGKKVKGRKNTGRWHDDGGSLLELYPERAASEESQMGADIPNATGSKTA
jgi:hypothetical protein